MKPTTPIQHQVWMAARRRTAAAHSVTEDGAWTGCGRSTRTGLKLPPLDAQELGATWCRKCWPGGTPAEAMPSREDAWHAILTIAGTLPTPNSIAILTGGVDVQLATPTDVRAWAEGMGLPAPVTRSGMHQSAGKWRGLDISLYSLAVGGAA